MEVIPTKVGHLSWPALYSAHMSLANRSFPFSLRTLWSMGVECGEQRESEVLTGASRKERSHGSLF